MSSRYYTELEFSSVEVKHFSEIRTGMIGHRTTCLRTAARPPHCCSVVITCIAAPLCALLQRGPHMQCSILVCSAAAWPSHAVQRPCVLCGSVALTCSAASLCALQQRGPHMRCSVPVCFAAA